jgi:hypothetical protein
MVGGEVIEVVILPDRVFIDCRDTTYRSRTCAIYVERTDKSVQVRPMDIVWWQGSRAFWTPNANRLSDDERKKRGHKAGVDYEIELPRIGYSGVELSDDDRKKAEGEHFFDPQEIGGQGRNLGKAKQRRDETR